MRVDLSTNYFLQVFLTKALRIHVKLYALQSGWDDKIMLNMFHINGVTMSLLYCSLYSPFCHWGKATKKTGTDLLTSFSVLCVPYFRDPMALTNSMSIPEIQMMNWKKWKQSWFANSIHYLSFIRWMVALSLTCANFSGRWLKEQKRSIQEST